MKQKRNTPEIEETDLRSISRDCEKCLTEVKVIINNYDKKSIVWLKFGECQIRQHKDMTHMLMSYLQTGVTDFEHDSAYALQLPLVGLQLSDLPVMYHQTNLVAWVEDDFEKFRVPLPGYNPMLRSNGAMNCSTCKGKEKHLMVAEGMYVPPFNQELFDAVKGKRVEITISPTYE